MSKTYKIFKFNTSSGLFTSENVSIVSQYRLSGSILAYRSHIFDMILFVLTCKVHRKVLLKLFERNQYFLPFFPLIITDAWQTSIDFYLENLFKYFHITNNQSYKINLLNLTQVKAPKYGDLLYQIVMQIELNECNNNCNYDLREFKWFKMDQILLTNTDIWGPDLYFYLNRNGSAKCKELSIQNEIHQHPKKYNLVLSLEYNDSDIISLYDDFVQHCYPSLYMNYQSFTTYINQSGMNISVNSSVYDIQRLFNSFCITSSHFISFKDFLLALIALDKKCIHGSTGGELRTRCIFRFYTKIGSQSIGYSELILLYQDIGKTSKRHIVESANKAVDALYKSLNFNKDTVISINKFVELVGSLVIRGTASIFRCNHSPLLDFRIKKLYSMLVIRDVEVERILSKKQFPLKTKKRCKQCNRQNYTVAVHSVLFNTGSKALAYEKELPNEIIQKLPKIPRENSIESVNPSNLYNDIKMILRRFSKIKYGFPKIDSEKACLKWEKKDERLILSEKILKVCNDSKELFKKLPRVLKVQSPVYVFGDIHGNFKDLMIYDHLFWKMAPCGFVSNSLFLGDYVDRGDNSVECILYLLCLKLLMPNKFHMLRGNHESRAIQQQFTFYKECLEKFGPSGNIIWESFNNVFDCMPLCAVIDEQIYCAHGGIPANTTRMENLYDIPMPLPNPNIQCKIAWEILWNDPVSRNEYKEFVDLLQNQEMFSDYPKGFLPNIKRGTAFYYSEDAIDNFLEQNDLSHIIRGHEVIPAGFQFQMDGKLTTIFSCSNYCGAVNESAAVFIENCKIRILKIETNQKLEIK